MRAQLHNVPGRKTDFKDCQWLQLLHSCGLLRGSFRPGDAIVRLRAFHRQMANLVEERTRCVQWMQKALDQMNVQIHRAVTDLTGTTGLAIVRAIVAGERDPTRLATLRDPRCRKSETAIAEHLTGTWRDEHLFNLASALQLFDALTQMIASYETRLLEELAALAPPDRHDDPAPPHPNPTKRKAITGRGRRGGPHHSLALLGGGSDPHRWAQRGVGPRSSWPRLAPTSPPSPSEKDFISWLRLCPRTPISGGKPLKKRRNALGANRVAAVLRMGAVSLQRSKTALGAAFRRLARRKDRAVAVFAMARKMAQLVYRMLRYGQDYVDIGQTAYEQQFQVRRLAGLHDAAKALGYTLSPVPTPAEATQG